MFTQSQNMLLWSSLKARRSLPLPEIRQNHLTVQSSIYMVHDAITVQRGTVWQPSSPAHSWKHVLWYFQAEESICFTITICLFTKQLLEESIQYLDLTLPELQSSNERPLIDAFTSSPLYKIWNSYWQTQKLSFACLITRNASASSAAAGILSDCRISMLEVRRNGLHIFSIFKVVGIWKTRNPHITETKSI